MDRVTAKEALDSLIRKSRVHLYKPIQIAEILHKKRLDESLDILDLESYRTKSKKWRDDVTIELLGRVCTSSAKFQDDLFSDTAIPVNILNVLAEENNRTGGAVEAYIYNKFANKHVQLSSALGYCINATRHDFDVLHFINSFRNEAGLKRSLDKVYEIIVFSLFSSIIEELDLKVEVSVDEDKMDILKEFEDFTFNVLNLDFTTPFSVQKAKVYRVGVTNAADRGLDMYANWGPAIQIKHLALDVDLAENIVDSLTSDKIIIVCKTAEKQVIYSLLNQIGWKSRIQSVITEDDLVQWYDKALRGNYSEVIGDNLLSILAEEISDEFPSVVNQDSVLLKRNYTAVNDDFWK